MHVRQEIAAVRSAMMGMGLELEWQDTEVPRCPGCGHCAQGEVMDGLITCPDCFAVLGRALDDAPEWSRDGTMKLERCGAPVSELYPCGSGSYMVARNTDTRKAVRMQTWTSAPYAARTLCKALASLSSEAYSLGLCESVATRAKHIYADCAKAPHLKGTRRAGLIEGCLYAAMQTQGGARVPSEIGGEVAASGIRRVMKVVADRPADPCSVMAYIARRLPELEACGPSARVAMEAGRILDQLGMGGRATPPTRATACALMTMPDANPADVCAALGCSRGAAARCLARLSPYREDIIAAATVAAAST